MTTIRIKTKTTGLGTPSSLQYGELATDGNNIYFGRPDESVNQTHDLLNISYIKTVGSGTITPTEGASRFVFVIVGAGGGGGNAASAGTNLASAGSCGGGGSTSYMYIPQKSGDITYVVGAGGASASAGGHSTVTHNGTTVTAFSGHAGNSNGSADPDEDSQLGSYNEVNTGHNGIVSTGRGSGGPGFMRVVAASYELSWAQLAGWSTYGFPSRQRGADGNNAYSGINGVGFGTGGGAAVTNTGTATTGGTGANGLIIMYEFR